VDFRYVFVFDEQFRRPKFPVGELERSSLRTDQTSGRTFPLRTPRRNARGHAKEPRESVLKTGEDNRPPVRHSVQEKCPNRIRFESLVW
jgi:hypothetical protein